MKTKEIVLFYASTESGDQYLALLPRKLSKKEFDQYCRTNYPDEFDAGDGEKVDNEDCLHGRQIVLKEGRALQL